jgi:hypothetical protein
MAHFKCPACRARVWRDGAAMNHIGDLCPACAGPLEPVERLEELVGFRALRVRPRSYRSVGDQVRDTIACHDATRSSGPPREVGEDPA